jgi:hypothetical protein
MKKKWRRRWDDEFKGYVLEPYIPVLYGRYFFLLVAGAAVVFIFSHGC